MNSFERDGWDSTCFIDAARRLATQSSLGWLPDFAGQVADRHIVHSSRIIQAAHLCPVKVYHGDTEPPSERNSKSKYCASKSHVLPTYDRRVVGYSLEFCS